MGHQLDHIFVVSRQNTSYVAQPSGKWAGPDPSILAKLARTVAIAVLLIGLVPDVRGATIAFVATDLTDVVAGEDLWQIEYFVSGRSFLAGEGFDIEFDPLLYGSLQSLPPAPSLDWDPLILQQPNPAAFPPFDVGIYDALALVDNASLDAPFVLQVVFLGGAGGSPGPQPFTIFDSGFQVVETGSTQGAIPEPNPIVLVASGVALFALLRRSTRRKRE